MEQELIKLAASIGAQAALKTYFQQRRKTVEAQQDMRLHNTKMLLENYRDFKTYSMQAIYDAEQAEDTIDILDLMWSPGNKVEIQVDSIKRSTVKTRVIIAHIDNMLGAYQKFCEHSSRPEEQRRYDILYDTYISNEKKTVKAIAQKYNIATRTVYLDLKYSISRMAKLIFGIDWILNPTNFE